MARKGKEVVDGAKDSPQPEVMEEEEVGQEIEEKILHLLSIYPIVSPTMLQGGLGPYMKPAVWRPVLDRLVDEGKVVEAQATMITPKGRYNTYTKLHLPGTTAEIPASVLEG